MQFIKQIHRVLIGVLLATCVCMAVENPNVSTSFKSNSAVPSQGQKQRLLTQPNPLSARGNDVVTGNVGGLRYFHGVVPYGSSYYSGANLYDTGTRGVTSFLRRSTNPIISDRSPGQTRSFYEPRQAVSSFYVQNGKPTALSQSVTNQKSQANPYALPPLSQKINTENLQRPLSTNNLELERILSRQLELKEAAKDVILEDDSKFNDFFETTLKPEELKKNIQELKPEDEQEISKEPELELLDKLQEEYQDTLLEQEATNEEKDAQKASEEERFSQHAEAKSILGEHKTFAGLAEAKFSEYMKAAEEFIREGKFYKAADAYSLAAIWMSEDPRPYAGKSFALFAAGEYMSSAYYLSRAIEIDPTLAAKKYDLAALIGNRDTFENRLIEITTWQERSDSGELAFLMAYVFYHDGKVIKATSAINKAEEKMPDSTAVVILKNIITPKNGTTP